MASSSGIQVNQECIDIVNEMRLKKEIKWAIFHIPKLDSKEIEVEEYSTNADWEEFRQKLINSKSLDKKGNEVRGCRYAVYDFNYELANGEGQRAKLSFISWSPDDTSPPPKMLYASSKDVLKRSLSGLSGEELQANDESDLEENEMLKAASKGTAALKE